VATVPSISGPSTSVAGDISGPCDEAEHANDPRCTGVGVVDDNSGHGGDDDGFDDNSGRGGDDDGFDDNSGRHGGDDDGGDDNSGRGGDDD
jgi:hypothetical protein